MTFTYLMASGFFLLMFFIFNHPFLIVVSLICQTLVSFMLMTNISANLWIAYIIFLVMVGGLLVVFIYLSALVPNEIFYFNKIFLLLIFFMPVCFHLLSPSMLFFNNYFSQIFKFTSIFLNNMIILTLMYFLVCMFVAMYVMNQSKKSPLKMKIYVKY